jgi:hypothetical protein
LISFVQSEEEVDEDSLDEWPPFLLLIEPVLEVLDDNLGVDNRVTTSLLLSVLCSEGPVPSPTRQFLSMASPFVFPLTLFFVVFTNLYGESK